MIHKVKNIVTAFFICSMLLISGCGRITVDGFSSYSAPILYGDIHAKLNGNKSGIIFIRRGAPFDLQLNFSFDIKKVSATNIVSLELKGMESEEIYLARESINVGIKPKPGDSRIYLSEKVAVKKYEEIEMNLILELNTHDGKQLHKIKYIFKKSPSSRWWFFWELV